MCVHAPLHRIYYDIIKFIVTKKKENKVLIVTKTERDNLDHCIVRELQGAKKKSHTQMSAFDNKLAEKRARFKLYNVKKIDKTHLNSILLVG